MADGAGDQGESLDGVIRTIKFSLLRPGLILDEEIRADSGLLLIPRWTRISEAILGRLTRTAETHVLPTEIRVIVPVKSELSFLVVDDEATNRRILMKFLSAIGRCEEAEDGEVALTAVRRRLKELDHYDLICLDIMMPKVDGHQALKEIRRMEEAADYGIRDRAKIIMTTALSDYDNVMKAFGGECDAYMAKPIRREELMANLRIMGLFKEEKREQ